METLKVQIYILYFSSYLISENEDAYFLRSEPLQEKRWSLKRHIGVLLINILDSKFSWLSRHLSGQRS